MNSLPSIQDQAVRYIRKANEFVTAKYKTPLFANKILAISLSKLREDQGQLRSDISAAEIRDVLGKKADSNIYRRLKTLSHALVGNVITVEDGVGGFRTFNIVTNVDYTERNLTIVYNREMKPYIGQLKSNYTTFELSTLIQFDSNYSYRIYEVLKKEAFMLGKKPVIYKSYNINELRCMIGLVNTDATYIRNAIDKGLSWDEVVGLAKKEDKQFMAFRDFRTRVLDVAKRELKEKADICFDYELERTGRGGRVSDVIFSITRNAANIENAQKIEQTRAKFVRLYPDLVQEEDLQLKMQSVYDEIADYLDKAGVDTELSEKAFMTLLDAASGDVERIKAEIDYGAKQDFIDNYYGWLVDAVRNQYSRADSVPVARGSEKKARRASEMADWRAKASDDERERVAATVWAAQKQKPEFPDFLEYYGVPLEELEEVYSPAQLTAMYIDFKKAGV